MILALLTPALAARDPYLAEHDRWTEDLQVIVHLETRLIVHATLVTEALSRTQAALLSELFLEGPVASAERMARAAEAGWSVIFTTSAPGPRYADAVAVDDSADWAVRLSGQDETAEILDLVEMDEPDEATRRLYPQYSRWTRLWRLRLRPVSGRSLSMDLSGPNGRGSLTWTL